MLSLDVQADPWIAYSEEGTTVVIGRSTNAVVNHKIAVHLDVNVKQPCTEYNHSARLLRR